MFTGITEVSRIVSAERQGEGMLVRIETPHEWILAKGGSVAVDGICSTVVSQGAGWFEAEYMPRTLEITTADSFAQGRRVNLERSLTPQSSLDGHFVLGHVDAVARVVRVSGGDAYEIAFETPDTLRRFITERGSVTVNGVSLTVARAEAGAFSVALIPHTRAATNLGDLREGEAVNIEADPLARYVVAALPQSDTVRAYEKTGEGEEGGRS